MGSSSRSKPLLSHFCRFRDSAGLDCGGRNHFCGDVVALAPELPGSECGEVEVDSAARRAPSCPTVYGRVGDAKERPCQEAGAALRGAGFRRATRPFGIRLALSRHSGFWLMYIDEIAQQIASELDPGRLPDEGNVDRLLRAYAVLVRTKGRETTLEDVHDAGRHGWPRWTPFILRLSHSRS
jgi:hypothetical protein